MLRKLVCLLTALALPLLPLGLAEEAGTGVIGGADGPTSVFVTGESADGLAADASIGVIGGADGPTSIFVTGESADSLAADAGIGVIGGADGPTSVFVTGESADDLAADAGIGVIGGADGPTSIFVTGELTDGLGRTVAIPETVEKVVSLTAANTEILYALGAGDLLVGADAYSDYPEAANELPRMGDYVGPNVELIAAAEADVVFASTTLQQDAIEKMEALGLNVVCVEPTGLDELYEGIVLIAAVVGADPTPLLADMQDAIAETTAAVPETTEPVRVYFALSFGESGDFSAGPGTFIDELIAMAGGENVAAGSDYAWPMYSLEGIVAADPDVILVSDYGDGTAVEQFCALPGYGELRAVQEGHVYALTDDLVSRPGPRIVEGLRQVADALADAGAYD